MVDFNVFLNVLWFFIMVRLILKMVCCDRLVLLIVEDFMKGVGIILLFSNLCIYLVRFCCVLIDVLNWVSR